MKGVKFVSVIFLIVLLLIFTVITLKKNKSQDTSPRGFMAERQIIYEKEYV